MKSRLAVITLLLTIGLSSAAAYADTITLTLNNPTQMTAPIGATLLFNATISAPSTNKANVFLNGDDFTVSSPLTLDDTDFFLNFPALLNPGQSVTDVSQNVMANLGWDEVRLPHPVFEGDTLRATTEVIPGGLAEALAYYANQPTPSLVIVESTEPAPTLLEGLDRLAHISTWNGGLTHNGDTTAAVAVARVN